MELNRDKVELFMSKNKMSQKDLADAMDVSNSTISGYLKKNNKARKKTIGRLAEALNVEVEEICD